MCRRLHAGPIPVMVLGRLAVDRSCQGQQLGSAVLKDAFLRTVSVSENVGIRALLVHAINDAAKQFYIRRGFQPPPVLPLYLGAEITRCVLKFFVCDLRPRFVPLYSPSPEYPAACGGDERQGDPPKLARAKAGWATANSAWIPRRLRRGASFRGAWI
jgi:hypothetical protein